MKGRGLELFGAFKLNGARGIPKECVPNSKPLLSPLPLHLPLPATPTIKAPLFALCCYRTRARTQVRIYIFPLFVHHWQQKLVMETTKL